MTIKTKIKTFFLRGVPSPVRRQSPPILPQCKAPIVMRNTLPRFKARADGRTNHSAGFGSERALKER